MQHADMSLKMKSGPNAELKSVWHPAFLIGWWQQKGKSGNKLYKTIKQYINREKTSKVIQLGTNYNMSLKDAGECVGIHDQNYSSRLFKKVTALTFTEYMGNLGSLPYVSF